MENIADFGVRSSCDNKSVGKKNNKHDGIFYGLLLAAPDENVLLSVHANGQQKTMSRLGWNYIFFLLFSFRVLFCFCYLSFCMRHKMIVMTMPFVNSIFQNCSEEMIFWYGNGWARGGGGGVKQTNFVRHLKQRYWMKPIMAEIRVLKDKHINLPNEMGIHTPAPTPFGPFRFNLSSNNVLCLCMYVMLVDAPATAQTTQSLTLAHGEHVKYRKLQAHCISKWMGRGCGA